MPRKLNMQWIQFADEMFHFMLTPHSLTSPHRKPSTSARVDSSEFPFEKCFTSQNLLISLLIWNSHVNNNCFIMRSSLSLPALILTNSHLKQILYIRDESKQNSDNMQLRCVRQRVKLKHSRLFYMFEQVATFAMEHTVEQMKIKPNVVQGEYQGKSFEPLLYKKLTLTWKEKKNAIQFSASSWAAS